MGAREIEEKYRLYCAALESAANAIVITDRNGVITCINPAFTRITGYAAEEAVGRTPRILKSGKQSSSFYREFWETIRSGRVWEGEFINRRKDGTLYYAEQTVTPIRDSREEITHFIGIQQDITERKKAEEELLKRTGELERSNKELEQFIFIASHDLQEPLRKIGVFTERLRKCSPGMLDESGEASLERIRNASIRMRELIEGLLLYSQAMREENLPSKISLETAVRKSIADLEARIREAGAAVEVGEFPAVAVDEIQTRILLENLIANAIMFHKEGEAPRVKIDVRKLADDFVEISVEDHGIGFNEKYLDRIFQPFRRLHQYGEFPGVGMGLAVCRKIVERRGGAITARSKPGKGATFIVTLPISEAGGRRP